jgi:trk system potassium uptake protein TrkH
MRISRFAVPIDAGRIWTLLCQVLRLLAGILLAPLLIAVLFGELRQAALFATLAVVCYGVGRLADRSSPVSDLALREAYVVMALAYLMFSLVGAIAFLPVARFLDGLFEAMSGFTTTGLSVMDVTALPRSLLFFRAYSQWIGGAGIVVLSLAVLWAPGTAAFRLYAADFKGERFLGNMVALARAVTKVYVILTAACFLSYWISGMNAFEALLHSLATISTGGFSSLPQGMADYERPSTRLVVCLFMLCGAVAFPLYYRARTDGWKRFVGDRQMRLLLLIVAVASAIAMLARASFGDLTATLFHLVSALTTTGFSLSEPAHWSGTERTLATLLMIVGGSTASTAGGIKLLRVLITARLGAWVVARALLPEESDLSVKYGGVPLAELEIHETLGFVGLYVGLTFLSAFLLALGGYEIADALFESASALGTVGLSTGLTSAGLATWAKLVLVFDMWAGRLEIVPLLVLLYPYGWRMTTRRSA